ncbi:MAG: phosphate signaling complex protein PhoU [Planctomycetes bacterium]|nr:phosphate signaling complex protein PhoU [Planctomycetota bacterium]
MAAVAETMIDNAISEVVTRDEHVADRIAEYEEDLNRTQIEVDELALVLLATQQPVARDLRFIMAATKINGELERIGDLVVNITENVYVLNRQPRLKPLIDIPRMADLARKMVRESVQAFLGADTALAQTVILGDDEVDGLKEQILRELLTYMISDPRTVERAIALILISRHLERIADHATNIAQDIIYMVEGRDVRHPKTPREGSPPDGRP